MMPMIYLTMIKFILDEVFEFLVVVVTVHSIWWTFTFKEWPIELGLKLEHLRVFLEWLISIILIRSQLVVILWHASSILVSICLLRSIFFSIMVIILFILVLLHNAFLNLLLVLPYRDLLVGLILVIWVEHHEFWYILSTFSWLVRRFP